jgi:succinoglycan biosynthesis protein ExoV
MILYQWRGRVRNFGDELNSELWPRLLPRFFDEDPSVRFLGIGSVLDSRHPACGLKLVAGAGFGGYEAPPCLDKTWIIHWVRGPRTARRLSLPPDLGLGDPAALLPLAGFPRPPPGNRTIGFMPHFESAAAGTWHAAAAAAGVTLIDPRDAPLAVLAAICRCRVLLSEALHGVIAADAMRIPWVALEPLVRVHRSKWFDWAESLELTIAFRGLKASSLPEWIRASGLASFDQGRRLLDRHAARLATVASEKMTERGAAALRRAAAATPQQSTDAALARSQARMMGALRQLRLAPLTQPHPGRLPWVRSGLHPRDDSAYHPHPTG